MTGTLDTAVGPRFSFIVWTVICDLRPGETPKAPEYRAAFKSGRDATQYMEQLAAHCAPSVLLMVLHEATIDAHMRGMKSEPK